MWDDTGMGSLRTLPGIFSPELQNTRDILIALPPSYDGAPRARYPVVYMQDGQNLFHAETAFAEPWNAHEQIERLAPLGLEAILVGIPNMGAERFQEYSPFVDSGKGGGAGDAYLEFVVETLKALVDRELRTRPEREATGILGSSMGGLISLYAFFRRPEAFGFAGAMSPSLWFAGGEIFPFVEQSPHVEGRLYLDVGTEEGATPLADARRMHAILAGKGYLAGETLLYLEDEGADHSEAAWARRLRTALYFLLPS
jgi:predicted alpha/beta superfamily hydrolase